MMTTRFVRVTDPDVAQELYRSKLLYEQQRNDPIVLAWGWGTGPVWEHPLSCVNWKFYVQLED